MTKIHNPNQGFNEDVRVETEKKLDEPKLYKVILHNDHYTTMDFVVEVLVKIFHLPAVQATEIMMHVHKRGQGICGVYPYDIAVTKIKQVHQMALERNFPLKSSYEEA